MKRALVLPIMLLMASCGGETPPAAAPPAPNVFTFAPSVGKIYRQTLTRHDEVAVVGAPLRQAEDLEMQWEMRIERESNLYRLHADLVSLKLSRNGATVLAGQEIASAKPFIDILIDPDGKLVDVRRADTVTEAIAGVVAPEQRDAARAFFAPDVLRQQFIALAQERSRDLLGQNADVGATWTGEGPPETAGAARRVLSVENAEPCGSGTCVRVRRETRVDRDLVWSAARARVEDFVKARGGDPSKVSLVNADVTLEDHFLVNPRTLEFEHITYKQKAELTVATAEGQLSVAFSTDREATFRY